MKITKPFLRLPVRYLADDVIISFSKEGRLVFDTVAKLDFVNYDHVYYMDVRRFMGESLEISTSDGIEHCFELADSRKRYTSESPLRPKLHFTSPEGWINDPNGLAFYEGKYHIFYQLNPNGRNWGNMTWGHATSERLTDFCHHDIAIFPDEAGTVFSGSGYIDEDNVLGLNTSEHKAFLLYYTSAGATSLMSSGRQFEQYLAVSTDGAKSFKRYGSKPVLPHIVGENRDPKIVYCRQSGEYIMSLYLESHRFGLFSSANLVDWRHLEDVFIDGDDECPAFYPLTAPDKSEKWVLQGAFDKYVIGSFDGRHFTPETKTQTLGYTRHSGANSQSVAYAAQGWTQLENGRTLRTHWVKTLFDKEDCYNGCLSVPQELYLKEFPDGLKLCAKPCKEFESKKSNTTICEQGVQNRRISLDDVANDITISFDENIQGVTTVDIMGSVFTFDFDNKTVSWTAAAGEKPTSTASIFASDGHYTARFITDTLCVEAFFADYTVYFCANGVLETKEPYVEILGGVASCFITQVEAFDFTDGREGLCD